MRAGPSNTISRPPRRSASSIEWVMKIPVAPVSRNNSRNSSRSALPVCSSSALNGSSHKRMSGFPAEARPLGARRRRPPERAWEKTLPGPGGADPAEPRRRNGEPLVTRDLVELESERDIIYRAAPRHQPVVLENDADLAAEPVELDKGIVPVDQHAALRGAQQAGDQVEGRRLAAAGLAEGRDQRGARDREAQVAHRLERLAVGPREGLADAVEDDRGPLVHSVRSAAAR